MNEPNEPRWKRVLAWIGLIWGGLILVSVFFRQTPPEATQMYVNGQYTGILFGFLMLCASIYYLFMRRI